jgi:hypothetical protein
VAFGVTTRAYDNRRSCANPRETVLTPDAVAARGKRRQLRLGLLGTPAGPEAEPLRVPEVELEDGAAGEVVYLTTMANQVWAYDVADGTLLWARGLIRPVDGSPGIDKYMINDHWGILGTPVIDLERQALYAPESDYRGLPWIRRLLVPQWSPDTWRLTPRATAHAGTAPGLKTLARTGEADMPSPPRLTLGTRLYEGRPVVKDLLDSQSLRTASCRGSSSAHLSIASSREDQASWERLRVRKSERAVRPRRKAAPPEAAASKASLLVSMCQIATATLRAMST